MVETAVSLGLFLFFIVGMLELGLYFRHVLALRTEFRETIERIAADPFAACSRDPNNPLNHDSNIALDMLAAEFSGDCPICIRLGFEAASGPRLKERNLREWEGTSVPGYDPIVMRSLYAVAEWQVPSLILGSYRATVSDEVALQVDGKRAAEICP